MAKKLLLFVVFIWALGDVSAMGIAPMGGGCMPGGVYSRHYGLRLPTPTYNYWGRSTTYNNPGIVFPSPNPPVFNSQGQYHTQQMPASHMSMPTFPMTSPSLYLSGQGARGFHSAFNGCDSILPPMGAIGLQTSLGLNGMAMLGSGMNLATAGINWGFLNRPRYESNKPKKKKIVYVSGNISTGGSSRGSSKSDTNDKIVFDTKKSKQVKPPKSEVKESKGSDEKSSSSGSSTVGLNIMKQPDTYVHVEENPNKKGKKEQKVKTPEKVEKVVEKKNDKADQDESQSSNTDSDDKTKLKVTPTVPAVTGDIVKLSDKHDKDELSDIKEGKDKDTNVCADPNSDACKEIKKIVDLTEKAPEIVEKNLTSLRGCFEIIQKIEDSNYHPLVKGALKTLVNFYQDCDAKDIVVDLQNKNYTNLRYNGLEFPKKDANGVWNQYRKVVNTEKLLKIHPYATEKALNSKCEPFKDKIGAFVFNAKPAFGYNENGKWIKKIDLHRDQSKVTNPNGSNRCGKEVGAHCESQPVKGIDCTGFISAALRASGVRMSQKGAGRKDHVSTSSLLFELNRKNTCLERAKIGGEVVNETVPTIESGDIISYNDGAGNSHALIISKTGFDPLGISKGVREKNCNKINSKDFDFTILHSAAYNHWGISQMRVRDQKPNIIGEEITSRLLDMSRSLCRKIVNGEKTEFDQTKDFSMNVNVLDKTISKPVERPRFAIIRNKGLDKENPVAACKEEPLEFRHQECVGDCIK